MTNLQAIDLLKGLEQSLDDYCRLNDEGKTAFGMAITALELFGNSEQLPSAQPEQPEPHWIPVSERLPEEPFGCLVTVWDTDPITMDEFENILPYFVGWDGEQWNDGEGEQCPFEVIAWMPLPEPYKEEEDETHD